MDNIICNYVNVNVIACVDCGRVMRIQIGYNSTDIKSRGWYSESIFIYFFKTTPPYYQSQNKDWLSEFRSVKQYDLSWLVRANFESH
jgi:hypothetical protein